MAEVLRTYRYRFYPTRTQAEQLDREFNCARFVWNWALDLRGKAWRRRRQSHTTVIISRTLTRLNRSGRYAWLNEATASCLTQKLIDQDRAFAHFFAKDRDARYPRFKRKRHAQAVRYTLDQRLVHGNFVPGQRLLRLPKLGALKLRWSRFPTGVPKMVTVRRDACGRWFVTLSVVEAVAPLPATDKVVGVDLGFRDVAVTQDGQKTGAPRHLRHAAQRLARAQRALARRQRGSGRRERQRRRVSRLHAKVADARHNFLHKLSSKLVDENQVICIEDLCVKGMQRGGYGKSVGDAGLRELRRQLAYKADWYGREVIVIDRFAPSSKRCSACGHVLDALAPKVTSWDCPACGAHHDRDINAAKNILYYASTARSAAGAAGTCAGSQARGGRVSPGPLSCSPGGA